MEELKEKKEVIFKLPDETITVKFLPKRQGMASTVDENHIISGNMLSKSVKRYYAPLNARTGGIANVLTNSEKVLLEKLTGKNLSVYGDFWTEFSVTLRKEDSANRFDLSDPEGYLAYALLRSLKEDIAPSWADRNKKGTYDFAIVREGELTRDKKGKLDVKKEAFKLYGKLEDDREKLIAIIKLFDNKPLSKDSKFDWLQAKVEEFVDTNPQKFLDIIKDSSFETKALINKGVDAGVIIKKSNKYITVDGLELSENGEAPSFNNAVKYLDSPKNQEIRSLIEARIDNANDN